MSTAHRIAWTQPDGSLGIWQPGPGWRLVSRVGQDVYTPPIKLYEARPNGVGAAEEVEYAQTEAEWLASEAQRLLPPGTTYHLHQESDFPPELRRWRMAWQRTGPGRVSVDLTKARAVRVQELQQARKVALAALREQIDEADDRNDNGKLNALKAKRKGLNVLSLEAWAQAATDLAALEREPDELVQARSG